MAPRPEPRGLYGQRPSRSADAARRRALERIRAMSPLERVRLAFELGRRVRLWAPQRTEPNDPTSRAEPADRAER